MIIPLWRLIPRDDAATWQHMLREVVAAAERHTALQTRLDLPAAGQSRLSGFHMGEGAVDAPGFRRQLDPSVTIKCRRMRRRLPTCRKAASGHRFRRVWTGR